MTTSTGASTLGSAPDLAWLVTLARRLARPGEDADDLAQETWLVAAQQDDRSKRSSRKWLAGVLRNLRRMRARTDRRRREREHDVAPSEPVRPDAAMEQLETLEALRVALDELDPVDRRLVLGRYATGQSAVELGTQFELPASTVRTRLARARERLREEVESVRGVACFAPFALRPFEASVGTAVGATGVVAMSSGTKIGIGAAAVILLAVGAQRLVAAPTSAPSAAPTVVARIDDAAAQAPSAERTQARAEAIRVKRERIRERRAQRIATRDVPARDVDAPAAIVDERCDDGCIGTLGMQVALAHSIAGCRDDLAPQARGKTKFRAQVVAEPGIGAVVESIDVLEDTVGDRDFVECIVQSAPMAELSDPEHPISDTFVFRYGVGERADPAREFLAAHPDLAAAHPELAALASRAAEGKTTAEEATAFARWIDQDPEAQAAFGKWAAAEGIDLAHVRVD